MKITNKTGLPQSIVSAVSHGTYDRGECDFSVSDLIRPPQLYGLSQAHRGELEEDAADRIWALMGTAVHYVIEAQRKPQDEAVLSEQRLLAPVGDWLISGKPDHFEIEAGRLVDFKITSAWAVMDCLTNLLKPDWLNQLNYYAYLLRYNGYEVNELQIVAILRDWSRANYLRSPASYPEKNIVVLNVPLLDPEVVSTRLATACEEHQAALDGNARPCTNSERWYNPGKIALMKHGRKSAVKLFDTAADVEVAAANPEFTALTLDGDAITLGPKHYLETRPNAYPRCENYCEVADYCDQWAAESTN